MECERCIERERCSVLNTDMHESLFSSIFNVLFLLTIIVNYNSKGLNLPLLILLQIFVDHIIVHFF